MYNLPKGVYMTPLQQVQYAFSRFLEIVRPSVDKVEVLEMADKVRSFKFQEQYVLKFAELVMCCEPFANLPFEDKVKFFSRMTSFIILVAPIPAFLVRILYYRKTLF